MFGMSFSSICILICFEPFFFVKIIHSHFEFENLKPVELTHWVSLMAVPSRNLCTIARFGLIHQNLKSSANKFAFTGYSMFSKMSFVANKNSVTDSNETWGIPFSCSKLSESVFNTLTENFLFSRKIFMQLNIFPLDIILLSFCNSRCLHIVS